MSLETQIAALVTAANNLTTAVNGKVAEINEKVKTATDSVPSVIRSLADQSFYIDAVNGLDTNTGSTTAAPIKTAAEAKRRAVNGGVVRLLFKSGQTHDVDFFLQSGLISCTTYGHTDLQNKADRATLRPALGGLDANGRRFVLGIGVASGQIYLTGLNITTDYSGAETMVTDAGFIRYTNSRADVFLYVCDLVLSDIPFASIYTGYSARDIYLASTTVAVKAGKEAVAKLLNTRNSTPPTIRFEVHSGALTNATWAGLLPTKQADNFLTNVAIA
ncbi:hypothetical protein [Pseudomonas aeruginosa]|uniref:hypothetical protein n=1 Tax=Pseudomonas aeruginosa TaxID=287 RepID=UPI001ADEFB0A|nr:hypothetical protein [Pseudomonas aeruginosa]